MASLDFSQFKAISFDCYGTLIDWETGILRALHEILRAHHADLPDSQILSLYGEFEPELQHPYRRYREVLADVVRKFGEQLGFAVSDEEAQALPDSLKTWPVFPDTNAALARLKSKFKLAIISNTDDDLFATTSREFTIEFDEVITAQQSKAYKPSLAPFKLALDRLNVTREQWLHAGQSVHHDVLPARLFGLKTVLVTRRGSGATKPAEGAPDLQVPDLETLANIALA